MSKNGLLIFSLIIAPSMLGIASAETDTVAQSEAVSTQQAPVKRTAAEEAKLAEKRKKVDEKKKELNGSEWEVTVKSQDKKEKDTQDTLTFQNDQISSKNLSKRGFGATNYTITVPDEGETAIWETMKTGKDGVAFIRGEWNKGVMTGVINEHLDEGKTTKEYSFSSSARVDVPPATASENEDSSEKISSVTTAPTTMVSKETTPTTTKSETTKKSGALISY